MWTSIAKPLRDKPQSAHYFYAAKIEAMQLFVSGKAKWPDRPQPRQVGHIIYRTDQSWRSLPDTIKDILDDPPLEARQAEAALLLGQLAVRDKRPDLAEGFYRRGLALLNQLKPPPGYPDLLADKPRLEKELAARLAPYDAPDKRKSQAIAKQQEIVAAEKSLDASERQGNELWRQAQAAAEKGQIAAAGQLLRQFVNAPTLADHPRAHEAQYRLGKCLLALNDPTGAFAQWDRAIKSDPAGPYRAQMLLDMADQLLFEEFDAGAAASQLDRLGLALGELGATPADTQSAAAAATAPATQPGVSPMLLELSPQQYAKLPAAWQRAYRSLLQRSALVLWIQSDPGHGERSDPALLPARQAASARIAAADKLAVRAATPDFVDPRFLDPARVQRLVATMVANRFGPTPRPFPARGGDPRVPVALLLGEVAFAAGDFEPARLRFHGVADPKSPLRPNPEQEGYALLRAGHCYHNQFKFDLAQQYYQRILAVSRTARTSAAATALQRQALLTYSVHHQRDKALEMMRQVFSTYPDTPDAQDAMFFTGVIWEWANDKKRAIEAYSAALARYPKHEGMRIAVSNRFQALGLPPPPPEVPPEAPAPAVP